MTGDLSSEKMRALASEWRKLDLQASMTEAEQARYDKLPELMASALERAADERAYAEKRAADDARERRWLGREP